MCTIAVMSHNDKTFMLKNFDYEPVPTGWTLFEPFEDDLAHFALVDHGQQGLNSGLNISGLGLQISRSRCDAPTPEKHEKRTVLNAEILSRFSDVPSAVSHLETSAQKSPQMFGGNVMLASDKHISVTEYFDGNAKSEIAETGYFIRANHSMFGLIDNQKENSQTRYEAMQTFVEGLYPQLPDLDRDDIVECCKERLRSAPILQDSTRSSFVIDIQKRRVDYMVGTRAWQTFSFENISEQVQLV